MTYELVSRFSQLRRNSQRGSYTDLGFSGKWFYWLEYLLVVLFLFGKILCVSQLRRDIFYYLSITLDVDALTSDSRPDLYISNVWTCPCERATFIWKPQETCCFKHLRDRKVLRRADQKAIKSELPTPYRRRRYIQIVPTVLLFDNDIFFLLVERK